MEGQVHRNVEALRRVEMSKVKTSKCKDSMLMKEAKKLSQAWRHRRVIPLLGKQTKEGQKFKSCLGYKGSSSSAQQFVETLSPKVKEASGYSSMV